jgi:DNA-binding MarR family transcriptional regulator
VVAAKRQPVRRVAAPPTLPGIGLDRFAPYLMNRIMGRYNAQMQDRLAALGLTTTKARILAVLATRDGLMVNALAVYCVIELSTMSRTIAAMTEEGLLRREEDAADSRARRIFITPQGRVAFDAIWPTMHEASESLFADIPMDERDRFVTTLQKVLGNIRVHPF